MDLHRRAPVATVSPGHCCSPGPTRSAQYGFAEELGRDRQAGNRDRAHRDHWTSRDNGTDLPARNVDANRSCNTDDTDKNPIYADTSRGFSARLPSWL